MPSWRNATRATTEERIETARTASPRRLPLSERVRTYSAAVTQGLRRAISSRRRGDLHPLCSSYTEPRPSRIPGRDGFVANRADFLACHGVRPMCARASPVGLTRAYPPTFLHDPHSNQSRRVSRDSLDHSWRRLELKLSVRCSMRSPARTRPRAGGPSPAIPQRTYAGSHLRRQNSRGRTGKCDPGRQARQPSWWMGKASRMKAAGTGGSV